MSDQVRKSATTPIPEGVLVVFGSMDGSPAHTHTSACKGNMDPGDLLVTFEEDLID